MAHAWSRYVPERYGQVTMILMDSDFWDSTRNQRILLKPLFQRRMSISHLLTGNFIEQCSILFDVSDTSTFDHLGNGTIDWAPFTIS